MIYVGADHRGFALKEKIKAYLSERGYPAQDMGTDSAEPVDYPLIAGAVAKKVQENPENKGIVICGSGAGVCIVANKFAGIRAAQAWNPAVAEAARNDDNANILCLSADDASGEDPETIVAKFLDTSFGIEERYKRRLEEIKNIEDENRLLN